MAKKKTMLTEIWETVRKELNDAGIELHTGGLDLDCDDVEGIGGCGVRVVCVAPDLTRSVEDLGKKARDQVVMVRLDQDATKKLDAWVEAGAVRSRSEAAAVFIQEGLELRARELEQLEDALRGVEKAKQKLRDKARQVLGRDQEDSEE